MGLGAEEAAHRAEVATHGGGARGGGGRGEARRTEAAVFAAGDEVEEAAHGEDEGGERAG